MKEDEVRALFRERPDLEAAIRRLMSELRAAVARKHSDPPGSAVESLDRMADVVLEELEKAPVDSPGREILDELLQAIGHLATIEHALAAEGEGGS